MDWRNTLLIYEDDNLLSTIFDGPVVKFGTHAGFAYQLGQKIRSSRVQIPSGPLLHHFCYVFIEISLKSIAKSLLGIDLMEVKRLIGCEILTSVESKPYREKC